MHAFGVFSTSVHFLVLSICSVAIEMVLPRRLRVCPIGSFFAGACIHHDAERMSLCVYVHVAYDGVRHSLRLVYQCCVPFPPISCRQTCCSLKTKWSSTTSCIRLFSGGCEAVAPRRPRSSRVLETFFRRVKKIIFSNLWVHHAVCVCVCVCVCVVCVFVFWFL